MMRVLHLPMPVAGMPWALAQGERGLGLESQVLYSHSNWLDYPSDICLNLELVDGDLMKIRKLISTFFSVRNKFDVFHFNYGRTLIHTEKFGIVQAELPFYTDRAKLFVTYNGCDARQKFPTMTRTMISPCHDAECYNGICNSGKRDRVRRKSIDKMAKYVRHMWAVNPDLLHFLPKEKSSFLPYSVIMENAPVETPDYAKKTFVIVHAPTSRSAKGSDIIIAAMEKIIQKYGSIVDFRLIENIPHDQAVKIYREADLVIDQILIGWYGALAIEVMSMGKPVICRIADEDLQFIPKQMAEDVREAFVNVSPDDLEEVIGRCIEDRVFLKRKSEAAINYARTWHDPEYVAKITKKAYESF